MSHADASRRQFLRTTAAAAAALTFTTGAAHALAQAGGKPAGQGEGKPPGQGEGKAGGRAGLEKRKFGKTDMTVTLLGFGGAEIGYQRTDAPTVEKLLNAALDAGLNVVDTAECYVDSEEQIAAAIGHRRKEFYLFTKCGHTGRGADWTKPGILASIERSLKRLKTDAVDLVQLHSCSAEELTKGECIEALEQAKKEGKTRYIGYSGDSTAARRAIELARFDALQTSVNICDQECIEFTLPLAAERQVGVIAKRPIANAVWRHDKQPESEYHHEYWRRLQELDYEFAKGQAKQDDGPDGAAGTALRFTAMQPGVSVLIVGTANPDRWRQNAELLKAGPLPKAKLEAIRARWKAVAKPDWVGQV